MSFIGDVLDLLGLGGDGPEAVANATAKTDVEVNPVIDVTSVNVIDLEPLRVLFGEISTKVDAGIAELRNQKIDRAENSRLLMSAGLLGLAILRKKSS